MPARPAALVAFLACGCLLITLMLADAFHAAPAVPSAPGDAAEAAGSVAGVLVDARAGGRGLLTPVPPVIPAPPGDFPVQNPAAAEAVGALGGVAADGAIPAPPADPLEDPPLTPGEKEAGIQLIPGGGRVDFKRKTLTLRSMVCIQKGLIELFACAEGGKEHESVLRIRCRPELVNLNLILFGIRKGLPRAMGAGGAPVGGRVVVRCEWEQDGRTVSVPAEEMIWNRATERSMDPVGWSFTGSQFVPERDVETGKPTGRNVFSAVYSRTMLATFDDPSALLNTPLPEGVDDSVFIANEKVVPPPGTLVRMTLRAPGDDERGDLAKAEAGVEAARWKRQAHGTHREDAGPDAKPPDAPAVPEPKPESSK